MNVDQNVPKIDQLQILDLLDLLGFTFQEIISFFLMQGHLAKFDKTGDSCLEAVSLFLLLFVLVFLFYLLSVSTKLSVDAAWRHFPALN